MSIKYTLLILCLFRQFSVSSAHADSGDTVNFLIGTDYRHYDNLFQLPDGLNPIGKGAERSDNVLKTNFGIKLNKQYAQQVFKFDYSHVISKYDNAEFLDFTANNYKAAWAWTLTPSFRGNLSSEKKVDLIPFSDLNNSDTQNIRTIETQSFDFDWSPHNVWHLLGGYTKLDSTNSQAFLPETSFKYNALEAGVKYSFPSNSFIAFKFRKRNGENQTSDLFQKIGKGFTENEEELSSYWSLSGNSSLYANLGHNAHSDDTFTLRDFSGIYGGAVYTWDATSKLKIAIDLSRRLSSYTDVTSSYSVYDALSIRPTWTITPKINIGGYATTSKRKYLGEGPGSLTSTITRVDDGLTYGVQATWVPRSSILVGVSLQHDERNSNLANRDFSSNSVGINGQLTF